MPTYKTNVYMQPIEPELQGSFPKKQFEITYRDFLITKRNDFPLYRILPPGDKLLHRTIDGEFSKIELLKSQIDKFLDHDGQTVGQGYLDRPPPKPRGPGRPPSTPREKAEANNTNRAGNNTDR